MRALSEQEALELLNTAKVGRLGCVDNGEPYVVPINYLIDEASIYSHSLPGRKIEALRAHPRACVQVDSIEDDFHWVSEGQPYREILNYAEKNQIDLICLGAHGAGFGMRTLFGSNVDRVLRQAPCPVLVTRPLKPAMSYVPKTDSQVAAAVSL